MNDKICVVTGATSGVGLAAAMLLAAQGAQLVLIGRDEERGKTALANVDACATNAAARFYKADLSRLAEVKRVAAQLRTSLPKIDVLINNAGAIYSRRKAASVFPEPVGAAMRTLRPHLGHGFESQLALRAGSQFQPRQPLSRDASEALNGALHLLALT